MRLVRSILIGSTVLLGACSLFEDDEAPPLALNVAVSPTDIELGDTARITLDVMNVGQETVALGVGGCNMDFVLTDASGRIFHPAELVYCTLELRAPIQLAPGATHRIEGFTTGRVVPQGSQAAASSLAPGTYAVRAQVWVKRAEDIVVRSDPLTITFRAAN